VRARNSGQKERGLASPGPLLTPWLVVRVRVTPAEEAPGLVTIDRVSGKGQLMALPAMAAWAGTRGRHRGCGFPGRQRGYAFHGRGSIPLARRSVKKSNRLICILTHRQAVR
jgi:hypothetical protein